MKHHVAKVKEKISEHRKELFIIFLIFILAFGTRAYLMHFELPFEFDPYWHARMLSYMIQTGSVPNTDPIAYWAWPGGMYVDQSSMLFWQISQVAYGIITLGSPVYSKDAVILIMKIMPALFGALASIGLYFLIKEIYGKKPAIAAAIFAAVMPAFVYRTMSGFFEPTSIGFMWITFGLYFLARAANRTNNLKSGIINAAIAAVLFCMLALSWKGYLFIYLILGLIGFFTLISKLAKTTVREAINYVIYFAIIMVPFFLVGWLSVGIEAFNMPIDRVLLISKTISDGSTALIAGAVIAFLLAVVGIAYFFKKQSEKVSLKTFFRYFTLVGLFAIVAVMVFAFATGKSFSSSGVVGASIGEENVGSLFLGNKYNLLFFMGLIGLVLLPWKAFKDEKDHTSIIVFFLALTTLFMAFTKLKFTFLYGLPLSATAGIVYWYGLNAEKNLKKIIGISFAFLLLVGLAAGSFFVSQQFPNIEQDDGWKESLRWLSVNTPKDSKIFNWWDEGHWIGFIGERGPIIDNRNADAFARADVALFTVTQDLNLAESMLAKYKPDYIMFGDDLLMKQYSLGQYAYGSANDPRIKPYFGLAMNCGKIQGAVSGQVNYDCSGNSFTEQMMNSIPTQWVSSPNQLLNDKTPIFLYRSQDNSKIYILNAETNNTVLAKMWFHNPEITNVEEIYSLKSVKIFKVK